MMLSNYLYVVILCIHCRRSDVGTSESVTIVTSTLRLVLILEHFRPKMLRELPTAAKLVRLMCVFLIGVKTVVAHDPLFNTISLHRK